MATAPIRQPMKITQLFGKNPNIYKQFGLAGHNGLDIVNGAGVTKGTQLFSMLPGVWHFINDYTTVLGIRRYYGYGAGLRLYFGTSATTGQEWTFGHLQNRWFKYDGQNLPENVQMAELDNTGFSTGSHLHIGLRLIVKGQVQNYNNGFKGSVDPLPYLKKLGFKFV
jgi:murein DD-endopeptidase MepM/ murein hydrolase activator NlpD